MAIHYCRLDEFWTKHQKFDFLNQKQHIGNVEWKIISPDSKYNWLTEGLHSEFENFIAIGSKEGKATKENPQNVIFKIYSRGVCSNEDAYVFNFSAKCLTENAIKMVENFNSEYDRWKRNGKPKDIDSFLNVNEKTLKWIRNTKRHLLRDKDVYFNQDKIRKAIYRPFCKQFIFFERAFNEDIYQFPKIFPTLETEKENFVICCTNHSQIPFVVHITNVIPEVANGGRTGQCFPFYIYDEEGTNRRENITDWALERYQKHYNDLQITKKAIFYYVYGLLHSKNYREKYAQNLKKELPRIPFEKDFWFISTLGKELADLHLNYENAEPFELDSEINEPIDWKVEKMRLSKDKKTLVYNQSITFLNIPEKTFDYKLGNRSALEWVIEQYRIKTDERSGIINDPNQDDNEKYIVDLIRKIITVSLKTVDLMAQLNGEKKNENQR
ncbi:MAG: hypothetical protein RIT27_382 [Pseudomonadota bacterium]|jgi:predicted helicase